MFFLEGLMNKKQVPKDNISTNFWCFFEAAVDPASDQVHLQRAELTDRVWRNRSPQDHGLELNGGDVFLEKRTFPKKNANSSNIIVLRCKEIPASWSWRRRWPIRLWTLNFSISQSLRYSSFWEIQWWLLETGRESKLHRYIIYNVSAYFVWFLGMIVLSSLNCQRMVQSLWATHSDHISLSSLLVTAVRQ